MVLCLQFAHFMVTASQGTRIMRIYIAVLTVVGLTASVVAGIPELEKLQSQYDSKRGELSASHTKKNQVLVKQYRESLERLKGRAREQGRLEDVLVISSVLDNLDQQMDATELRVRQDLPELRRLQVQVKNTAIEELASYFEQLKQLEAFYKNALERLVRTFTQRNRIDDAVAVRELVRKIEESSPPPPPVPSAPVPPRPAPLRRPSRTTSRIPPAAKAFGGHYYKVYRDAVGIHWLTAKTRCEEWGGYLVSINSQAENDFLEKMLGGRRKALHLGATDRDREGRWVWADGSPMTYENWENGQPDNNKGHEHYLECKHGPWPEWNDAPGETYGYICEWESGRPMKEIDREKPFIHYRFDDVRGGIVPDQSGNGNDARVISGIRLEQGVRGKAAVFSGRGCLHLPDDWGQYPHRSFTIVFWLKRGRSGAGCLFDLNFSDDPDQPRRRSGLKIFIPQDGDIANQLLVVYFTQAERDMFCGQLRVQAPTQGSWTHFAMTRHDSQVALYQNGKRVATGSDGDRALRHEAADRDDHSVTLGCWRYRGTDGEQWFDGSIDEFLLYPRALSGEEIEALCRRDR